MNKAKTRSPARKQRAFTLVEVLICMALFAVGFASIAIILPSGTMMQRSVEGDINGAICGRNALEVMKGKGMHALTYQIITAPSTLTSINRRGGATHPDMERQRVAKAHHTMFTSSSPALAEYWNTNGDALIYKEANASPNDKWVAKLPFFQWTYLADTADHTNWGLGRIHVLKNRPIPGSTLGWYTPLDFSTPSSVLDISARTYVSSVLYSNNSRTPALDQRIADPNSNSWHLTAITLRVGQGITWPEQVESDPASTNKYDYNETQAKSNTPLWLLSNSGVDMRSSLAGGGGLPTYKFPELRGYCGETHMWRIIDLFTPPYADLATAKRNMWGNFLWNHTSHCFHTDACTPDTGGAYNLPAPLAALALVYDKKRDLVLIRYPQAFARTPVADNTRINTYRTQNNITPATWVDRKLKKGDTLMSAEFGYVFTVKNLLDVAAEAEGHNTVAHPIDWSDGTYQLVQVTPSLNTTVFTDNVAYQPVKGQNNARSNSTWKNPYLSMVLVAPPAIQGGPSPWVATAQLDCGHSQNANAKVFRNWDNLAE